MESNLADLIQESMHLADLDKLAAKGIKYILILSEDGHLMATVSNASPPDQMHMLDDAAKQGRVAARNFDRVMRLLLSGVKR